MIDWTVHDKHPESTCHCHCGAIFRSHAKFVMMPTPHLETRKPCPACGKTADIKQVSSDPEIMVIGRQGS